MKIIFYGEPNVAKLTEEEQKIFLNDLRKTAWISKKIICLTHQPHTTVEDVSPGDGRNGGAGQGGEPLRYTFLGRGVIGLSPWSNPSEAYTLGQMYLGYNPLSKIEIVSGLNVFNYASGSLAYNSGNRTQKYNPKVYLGTVQTTATSWNYDSQTGIKYPSIWPEVKPQKGEANYLFWLYCYEKKSWNWDENW